MSAVSFIGQATFPFSVMLTGLYKVLDHPLGQVQEKSKTIPFAMEDIHYGHEAGTNKYNSLLQSIFEELGR